MSTQHESILEKARNAGLSTPSAGMKVPDAYFDTFADRMAAMLPERPAEETTDTQRSFWSVVRPYVYMAAMFAGVWLMLHMFTLLSGTGRLQPMDSNPVVAEALNNDAFVNDYIYDNLDTWDLIDEMMEDGALDQPIDFGLNASEASGDYILPDMASTDNP